MSDARLSLELAPSTCSFSSLRSKISKDEWANLAKMTFLKANHCCEICGGQGEECHEVWLYDDDQNIQSLQGLIALCLPCHEVKHFALATRKGRRVEALHHLAKVNQWSMEAAESYVASCIDQWFERSRHEWQLDLESLKHLGINMRFLSTSHVK